MEEPIISFKDFSFKYHAQKEPTLKEINLEIYPGEKVLVVGPSGSGKSTLAHCINGLVPFFYGGTVSGSCTVKGRSPKDLGIFGLSQIVGTVLQDTDGQFIGLTVAEDIAFALENDCVAAAEMRGRVERAAGLVDVSELMAHAPNAVSGGQKQRVSIAGVLVSNVEVLLFDEPLANLDPATGKRTIELIEQIKQKQESTIIIIEHRLEDVLYRDVDRIVLVGDGRIVCDTTPDKLLSTDVLRRWGIREPLYIAALRHAGCKIEESTRPQHIESMDLSAYKQSVKNWYENAPSAQKQNANAEAFAVRDLSFSYDGKAKVLDGVGFSVKAGEMLALVGKNGAGKSTLAGLICGFFAPTGGSIMLNGSDISPLSIKERGEKIGLVMQNPNQMISKPMIFDEVALGLAVRGVPSAEIKERVHETLKTCGLYPFRNWPVSALSFGQKKRVTIASILVMKPQVLILDEPTAGQDYRHYTEIMEFLKGINEKLGITVLMITHDMHLMLEYTQRALVLAGGKLLADASPAKVLTDEAVSDAACLKKTSLYDLALGCGIEEPSAFVERFILCDRREREAANG